MGELKYCVTMAVATVLASGAFAPATYGLVTLTGGDVTAGGEAGTVNASFPAPAVGVLQFDVDLATGHLYLVGNNTGFVAYEIDSAGSKFNLAGYNSLTIQQNNNTTAVKSWAILKQKTALLSELTGDGDVEFLGANSYFDLASASPVLWTGTSLSDLTFKYGDATGTFVNGSVFPVPEPTTLGLSVLVSAGLLARRKRRV